MATKTFFINSDLANYGEEEFNYLQKFLLQQGILNSQGADYNDFADLKVTQNGGGNMSVNVAVGVAVINTVRSGVTFKVFVSNQAIANLVVANNTSGSNRIDPVILKISRTTVPDALMANVATLQVLTGLGVSAMTDNQIQTAIGADYDFIRLANLTVANNATQILTANIADTRIRCYTTDVAVPNPTIIKFRELSADPATPVEGEMWYNTTANILRYYNGTSTINIQASTYTGGNGIDITAGVVTVKLPTNGGLRIDSNGALTTKFGGTGADGALSITSGTTTIDLTGLAVFVKNYSSISITGTGALAFSNPHANGTVIVLKSTGNVTLTSSAAIGIDLRSLGASATNVGRGLVGFANGGLANSTGGGVKIGGTGYIVDLSHRAKCIKVGCGAGGGAGGNYAGGDAGGAGGRGGGGLYIECAGALNFASPFVINATGVAGGNGTANNSGGGGGGGGGTVLMLYGSLTANTGTISANGGVGGNSVNTTGGSAGVANQNNNASGGQGGSAYNASYGGGGSGGAGAGCGGYGGTGGNGQNSSGYYGGAGGGGGGGGYLIEQNLEF